MKLRKIRKGLYGGLFNEENERKMLKLNYNFKN